MLVNSFCSIMENPPIPESVTEHRIRRQNEELVPAIQVVGTKGNAILHDEATAVLGDLQPDLGRMCSLLSANQNQTLQFDVASEAVRQGQIIFWSDNQYKSLKGNSIGIWTG